MFELGDIVTIRPDLSPLDTNVNSEMVEYAGRRAIVTGLVGRDCQLDIDNGCWLWSRDMLVGSQPAKPVVIDYKPEQVKWSPKPLEESVRGAIEAIKTGYYKGTYLKMELEAQLDRGVHSNGDSEECDECYGEGYYDCNENHDHLRDDDGNVIDDEYEESCDYCDQGSISCNACEGSGRGYEDDEWNNGNCQNFIEGHVSNECRQATVYSGFVYDGSVDSEFKFTVPLSWEGLQYAIEYINAFKQLAEAIGNGIDVRGAGMHITVLRSEDGDYPQGNGRIQSVPFDNFRDNMTKLMPALYLLASEDNKSRGMSYRRPGVRLDSHGHAIAGAGSGSTGALEWRVFETCYRRPEMLFDFICVIAKGLSYYAPAVQPVKFRSKIGQLDFYDKGDEFGVHKFFHTEKHIVALKSGLKYLLPDHRTEIEVLRLRNVHKLTPESIKRKNKRLVEKLETSWQRYRHDTIVRERRYLASMARDKGSPLTVEEKAQHLKDFRLHYSANKRRWIQNELQRTWGRDHTAVSITI